MGYDERLKTIGKLAGFVVSRLNKALLVVAY